MKKALEVVNYSFQYEATNEPVLKGCNLTLHYGEFLVLSGLSGEGKSTLLSSINGIIPNVFGGKQEGEIRIDGESILHKKMAEISYQVGSVLQNADSQIVHATVEDEIAFGCENRNLPPEEIAKRIREACKMMELQPEWQTRTLSGGQKQRLITASTLAMGQKILIFDEPLANLDLEGSHILLKVLKRLVKEEGYAVLFVEHRLDVVIPYADRIAWLKEGSIEMQENKEDTLTRHINLIPDSGEWEVSEEPCLSINHLAYTVRNREILKDVSFTIHKGERVVILGENGCGKTTLLRLLARLNKPTGGKITAYILSNEKGKASPQWFQKVGFVYQNPNYQLFMPQVSEEIGYQSPNQENTGFYLKAFDLTNLACRHPQSLSEGQKRRVSIAAIAAGPIEVLLLDEPTVGQDYNNLKHLVDTLNALHKEKGTTMVTVTHDYRCASALADKVIWIDDGRVYKQGGKELIEEYFIRHIQ